MNCVLVIAEKSTRNVAVNKMEEEIAKIIDETYQGDFMYHDIIPKLIELIERIKNGRS